MPNITRKREQNSEKRLEIMGNALKSEVHRGPALLPKLTDPAAEPRHTAVRGHPLMRTQGRLDSSQLATTMLYIPIYGAWGARLTGY